MNNISLLDLLSQHGYCPGKRVSTKNGGEYHGPCPGCGGEDRFICWPNEINGNCIGRYFCRRCGKKGDTIQLLMDFEGMTFAQAKEAAGSPLADKKYSNIDRKYSKTATKRLPSTPLLPPTKKWQDAALTVAEDAHKQIFTFPEVVAHLEKRGITKECIQKFKLGYNPTDLWCDRAKFGLEFESNENGQPKKVSIPKGIVIPTFDTDGTVLRLKIRRANWREGDKFSKYVNVTNNANVFSIFGDPNKEFAILCESELDAITIAFYAGDFAFAISAGSNITNPDNRTKYLVDTAKALLINYDNDDAGRAMFKKWRNTHPKAIACSAPKGKDIGEAFEQGLNVEQWLRSFLAREGFKVAQPTSRTNSSYNHNEEVKEAVEEKKLDSTDKDLQPVENNCPKNNQVELDEALPTEISSIDILAYGLRWNENGKEDSEFIKKVVYSK